MTGSVSAYIDDRQCRAELPVSEAVSLFMDRIEAHADLNCIVRVAHDRAEVDAERAQRARDAGRALPLDGMPILVKDNIDVAGIGCGVGSPLYEDRIAADDAPCVSTLSLAGAVILGKTALHELVFGGTTDSPFYGRTKNPWDLDRIVGGSSGGSGAAVAAGMCVVALGSDTGGSIRVPGHANGVLGFRPTFGAVSVQGVVPIGPSLDTVGPLSRWATDAALVHSIMAGKDWADPYSRDLPAVPVRPFVRVARLSEKSTGEVDPGVRRCIDDATSVLSQMGCHIREIDIEGFADVRHRAARMIQAEAWSRYSEDLMRTPEKFSPETQDRLRLGSTVTGEEYVRAEWRIQHWRRDIQWLLSNEIDLLVLPCAPVIAPVAGAEHMVEATARMTSFTLPISAAHVPAVSVPCGIFDGMPVGVQLVAAPARDLELLALAERFQTLLPPEWPVLA